MLILKIENSKLLKNYCYINLCNVSYKLIAKIFVGKLKKLLHKLIYEEHVVFVASRSISNNILLV